MGYLQASELGCNNHVVRLSFLRAISGDVTSWSKEELRPYVVYLHEDRVVDAFYGGLLFEADLARNGEVLSGRALGFGEAPTSAAWQQAIDELFLPDRNIPAALELSKERPLQKTLDIWIALPYPLVTRQLFGTVRGQSLDFIGNVQHRTLALQWWIDGLMEKWREVTTWFPGHHARLCGFVWTKNSLAPDDETVIRSVCHHVHQQELKILWCSNYGTARAHEGALFGFDAVCARSTYTGRAARGINWLKYTASYASVYRYGMVLVGDPRVSPYQMLDFLNTSVGTYAQAFQIHELPGQTLLHYYRQRDPMYVYLYCYTKQAFSPIRYEGERG